MSQKKTAGRNAAERVRAGTLQAEADLRQTWPEVVAFLSSIKTSATASVPAVTEPLDRDSLKVSQEERAQLLEQLKALTALPPGQLDSATAQELSLRLQYCLGHQLSFQNREYQLSYSHGSITAVTRSDHLGKKSRSTGSAPDDWSVWISPRDFSTELRSQWHDPWFLHQHVVVFNPAAAKGVVAQIAGILTEGLHRYQFGGSKKLLQTGNFWAPGIHGRCIVCFLGEALPLGSIIPLAAIEKTQ